MRVLNLGDLEAERLPSRAPLDTDTALIGGIVDAINTKMKADFQQLKRDKEGIISVDFEGKIASEELMNLAFIHVYKSWPTATLDGFIVTIRVPAKTGYLQPALAS